MLVHWFPIADITNFHKHSALNNTNFFTWCPGGQKSEITNKNLLYGTGSSTQYSGVTYMRISSVQLLSRVRLFVTPWTATRQASLSITNSWSLLRLMSIESVMPSNHLILCRSLLLPPSIFPSIRVFSNESDLRIRWSKYWSSSFSISPSNEYSGLISFGLVWSPCSPRDFQESSPIPKLKISIIWCSAFFMVQLSLLF